MEAVEIPALVVRVDDLTCAIPCGYVVETMRSRPLTELDGMPAFAAGLATIRGAATPVLSLAAMLGRNSEGSRLVTLRTDEKTVALLVDEVVGVVRFAASELQGRPPILTEAPRPFVHALARKDDGLHLVLNATRLIEHGHPVA